MICCTVNSQKYEKIYRGRRTFARCIKDFLGDRSLWPESFSAYFEPFRGNYQQPTYSMLVDWMAQEAGIPEMADSSRDHSEYVTRIGRYSQWAKSPEKSAGEDILLITAIAHCRIIKDKNGRPITDPLQLVRLIRGNPPYTKG